LVKTSVLKIHPDFVEENLLVEPAKVIREGGLVVFPTETVYGLGANALDPKAVKSIFEAKGRPQDNPLICHISDYDDLNMLVDHIPECAKAIAKQFWPGPLTMIFNKSKCVSTEVSAGLNTVAVRMPANKIAQELIRLSGKPIAAPSANLSGKPSPTNFEHVECDMLGKVDIIIDGGQCDVGLESTVLDVSVWPPVVLRPGGITLEQLQSVVADIKLFEGHSVEISDLKEPVRSPGLRHKHYAPKADVYLLEGTYQEQIDIIQSYLKKTALDCNTRKKTGFMISENVMKSLYKTIESFQTCSIPQFENFCFDEEIYPIMKTPNGKCVFKIVGKRDDLKSIAHELFKALRDLDELGVDIIIAESFPEDGVGLAIMNRLSRSSGGKTINHLLF